MESVYSILTLVLDPLASGFDVLQDFGAKTHIVKLDAVVSLSTVTCHSLVCCK